MKFKVDSARRLLDMLGLARRSGGLAVGQDKVLRSGRRYAVYITTDDCSSSVVRKIEAVLSCGEGIHRTVCGVTREELGHAVGVSSAQIVAIPASSGFAAGVTKLLCDAGPVVPQNRRRVNEQDQSI